MKVVVQNEKEAKEFIDQIKGYLIAELMHKELLKQPESIRHKIYDMLIEKENF